MSFYGKIYQEANSVSAKGLSPGNAWIEIKTETTEEQTTGTIKHALQPLVLESFTIISSDGYAYQLKIDAAGHIVSINKVGETRYLVSCEESQGNITISPSKKEEGEQQL